VWSKENVWVYGVSAAGFVRREVTDSIGRFDENLGMGAATPYQSGEDVDYFVRPLELGWKIGYDPALTVHHPSFHRIDRVRERSYSYALGGGYTLRTHHYPLRMLMESLVRSMGGAVVSFFRGNFLMSQSYILRGAGVARGYFLGPSDLRKARLNTD
jgi:GT2 family glycosyltransferase